MTRIVVVFAAGVLAIAVGVAVVMGEKKTRMAGSNSIKLIDYTVTTEGRKPACKGTETVPRGTVMIEVDIRTYGRPGPPLEASATTDDGRVITRGRLAPGWREGVVYVPVEPVKRTVGGAAVCFSSPDPGRLGFRGRESSFRLTYLRAGRESWWDYAGTVKHRFGLAKASWQGPWTVWLVGLLLVASLGLALVTMLRSSRD